jgi:hypothetical protein
MSPTGPDVGPPNTTENTMTRLTRSRAVVTTGLVLGTATVGLALAPAASAAGLAAPTAPSTVTAGKVLTVSGTDCGPITSAHTSTVLVATPADDADIDVAVDVDGSWTAAITFPAYTPADSYDIFSACEQTYYGKTKAYPTIQVNVTSPFTDTVRGVAANTPGVVIKGSDGSAASKSVVAGQKVVRILTGFKPFEVVKLTMHSTPVVLGTFTADANGVVTAEFTIPAGTELAAHNFVYEGHLGTYFQEELTVGSATPVKPASSSDSLAYTGASVALPLGIGGALLLAGGGAMIASRRRTTAAAEV